MNKIKEIYRLGELELKKYRKENERTTHPLIDLFWECTLTCNAACKHCGSSAEKKEYEGQLSTEEIKEVFRNIAEDMDAKKIHINVTGGEPLTRKDLFEVMEYASSLGFQWGMTTNGILLTPENIEKLKKAKMVSISVSLDGLEETHDAFRGVPGSYKKILENVTNLVEAGFVKETEITTVVHKNNYKQLEELYDIVKSTGVKRWRIANMDPIGRAQENKDLLLNGQELREVLNFIVRKNSKKLQIEYGCPGFLGTEYEKEVRPYLYYCRAGILIGSILYNGDIYVCPNVPRIKKLIQGNVRKDRFSKVWNEKFEYFRDPNRNKCKKCEKCMQWDYCLGGPVHTWDFNKKEPKMCVYEMINKQ